MIEIKDRPMDGATIRLYELDNALVARTTLPMVSGEKSKLLGLGDHDFVPSNTVVMS